MKYSTVMYYLVKCLTLICVESGLEEEKNIWTDDERRKKKDRKR